MGDMDDMKIVEIFKSIQGEGPYIGKEMIFVRLAGCNLTCSWCDTKYSWDGNEAEEMTPTEAMMKIVGLRCNTVCFTGGEPLVQQQELSYLIRLLSEHPKQFETHIETNGTIIPENYCKTIHKWSISPKDGGYPEVVNSIIRSLYNKSVEQEVWIKFVVSSSADVQGINTFMMYVNHDVEVVVQPERYAASQTFYDNCQPKYEMTTYLKHLKEITEWCHGHLDGLDWRVLPQLHYLLWGDKTGV